MIYLIDHRDSFTFNLEHLLSNYDDVFVEGSTGEVGIGDATPDGKLEVRQTAALDIFNLYDNFDFI